MIRMSANLPIIDRWEREGYEWKHIEAPIFRPITIPANGEVMISEYKYEEGVLINAGGAFDDPNCGLKFRWGPETLDTGTTFVVSRIALGLTRPEEISYALVPPHTPPGIYVIRIPSAWKWESFFELYVINTDSVPHTCIAVGYLLTVTNKKPKVWG